MSQANHTKGKNPVTLETVTEWTTDEGKARKWLELRRWPLQPHCPHCRERGAVCGNAYRLNNKTISNHPARPWLYKCGTCRKQFTVTVGTFFQGSHIPVGKWLFLIFQLCNKVNTIKGTREALRSLGVGYKPALYMVQRVRNAITTSPLSDKLSSAQRDHVAPSISQQRAKSPMQGRLNTAFWADAKPKMELTLSPLSFEDAIEALLKTKPPKRMAKNVGPKTPLC